MFSKSRFFKYGVLIAGPNLLRFGLICFVGASIYSLFSQDFYTSDSLLTIVDDSEAGGSGFQSIASRYGGLASLAGVSINSGASLKSDHIIATIKSRAFYEHIAKLDGIYPSLVAVKSYDPQTKKLSFDELTRDKGIVSFTNKNLEFNNIYPSASKYLGNLALKGLLNISRLVGMYCPGLRSIFSTIDISIISNPKDLEYKVVQTNRKLGYSKLKVNGLNLDGSVSAYFTEEYIEKNLEIKNVKSNKYKDSSALVIGSSGLGGIVSNIIIENNGKVVLTSRNFKKTNNLSFNMENYCSNLICMELDIQEKDSINYFFKNGIDFESRKPLPQAKTMSFAKAKCLVIV